MPEPPFDKSAAHRWFAVELNSATWGWLEAGDYDQNKQATLVRLQARELGEKIADKEDKAFFDKWHRAGNWHGLSSQLTAVPPGA